MAGNWTDAAAIDAWIAYLEINKNRSPRTLEAYRLAVERLQVFMADRSILTADPVDLEAFCGLYLHKKGVVAQSRKPYISAVKGFYAWCRGRGVIHADVALELEHPKTGRPLPNTIGLAEAERLMCAPDLSTFIGIRDCAILHLLIGCGLRVSGLCNLNEGDLFQVDIGGRPRLALRTTEKGDRERQLPVPREAEAILRVYLAHEEMGEIDRNVIDRNGRSEKVLFVSTRNTTVTADRFRGEERRLTRQAIHDIVQKHGLPLGIPAHKLHPHAMRHLFGTELTEGDAPTLSVQSLMGHADPKSTAIYTELAMRKKTQLVDQHAPLAKIRTPVSELLKRMPG